MPPENPPPEKTPSRFKGILTAAKAHEPEPAEIDPAPSPAPPAGPEKRGPGRPRGKRSDPGFDQVTAYIPHEVNRRVRLALIEDDRGQEFSELVADLLSAWLAGRHAE